MRHWLRFLIVCWLAIGSAFSFQPTSGFSSNTFEWVAKDELPPEARQTLSLVKAGGPFPYTRDGIVFGNFEKRLPQRFRGYYREYTVKSPWRSDRGPRRIIAGEGSEFYYTDDHYRTFRRIRE